MHGLITGLHHITLVTSNETVNRRFYTEVMGLRRVKLSVNQDDVYHRHLFYADEQGTTGSAITFFEWPTVRPGSTGLSSPHHLSYAVKRVEALPLWQSWLAANGVKTVGPVPRGERMALYLRDPDGVTLEISAPNNESLSPQQLPSAHELTAPSSVSPGMRLLGFHHASPVTSDPLLTTKFFQKFLGLDGGTTGPNPDERGATLTTVGTPDRPDFLRYLGSPAAPQGTVGRGGIHHIAMAVHEAEDQVRLMRQLDSVGVGNSGIIDRFWFRSLYFQDPDGNLLEVATKKPGYTADESLEELGTHLVLPPWLEARRAEIEARLAQTDKRNMRSQWPPRYSAPRSPPEGITGRSGRDVESGDPG